MKRTIKILLLLIFFNGHFLSQVNWNLDYDSANFAFLKLDYNNYNFEGGYFTKFNYNKGYDEKGIPFTINYTTPLDYGNIAFLYSATGDSIFAADIWWAGIGEITFPDSAEIEDSSQFKYDNTDVDSPYSISYINYVDEVPDSIYHIKADSAWRSIRKISVLKKFNEEGNIFRVGLYLYAPTVGSFDPAKAKWIIFLYRGQLITNVDDNNKIPNSIELLQNYPNPFNPTTRIEFILQKTQDVKLELYDILGIKKEVLLDKKLRGGKHSVIFDGSKYSSGVYFYRLTTNSFSKTKKILLLK